jgi:hypothetical protein
VTFQEQLLATLAHAHQADLDDGRRRRVSKMLRSRTRTPPLMAWPHLGHFDPPPRLRRPGAAYGLPPWSSVEYGGVCPRCRATAHHRVMATSWRAGLTWRRGEHVPYHCTRCRVRWTQPHHPFLSYGDPARCLRGLLAFLEGKRWP